MSVNPEGLRRAPIERTQTNPQSPRTIGGRALRSTLTPGSHDRSQADVMAELAQGVKGAVLHELIPERKAEADGRLTVDAANRAFMKLQRSLEDEEVVEEMSTKELMQKRLALCVLYAPTMSEALANGNTKVRSKYNDLLTDAAVAIPQKYMNFLVPVIRGESNQLNNALNIPSLIGDRGVLEERMKGIRPEVCVLRAANGDGDLSGVPGTIKQDGQGIDATISRHSDGVKVHIDVKNRGAFKAAVDKWYEPGSARNRLALESGYARTRYDHDGVAKYIYDASRVAEIPDNGLEYSPKGAANTCALLNEILDIEA